MLFDGLFQLITAVVSTQAIGFSNCTAIIKILSIRGGLLGGFALGALTLSLA